MENEDICTFTTSYASGAVGTFSLSRVAFGHANTLRLDLFCENGTASFDLTRPAEFTIIDGGPAEAVNGDRRCSSGRGTRTSARGLPMDFPTVGHGQNDFFVFQARAFLDQIAGVERAAAPAPTWRTACTTCASSTPSSRPPTSPSSCRERRPMKLGAYTACLHDRSLDETLKILGELGLTSAEINAGGFIPAPHLPIDDILASAGAREDYLGQFAAGRHHADRAELNGNPLNPDPEVGPKHAEDLRRAIEVAALLGVKRVVTMSGLPGGHPGGTAANWVVNPWDSQYLDILDYQWNEVAVPFWKDIHARAAAADVKVCIEMHPHNLVFNPPTLQRLVEQTGATHVGAEMDPSHLFWQGIDPVAGVEYLGDLVFHAAAKDTRINAGQRQGLRGAGRPVHPYARRPQPAEPGRPATP